MYTQSPFWLFLFDLMKNWTAGAPQTLLKERKWAFVNKCFLQPVVAGCLGCFCITGFSWHRYQWGNACNLQIQSPRNTLWNHKLFLIIGVFSLLTCQMVSFWHLISFCNYSSIQTILQNAKCCLMKFFVAWRNSMAAHGRDPLAS